MGSLDNALSEGARPATSTLRRRGRARLRRRPHALPVFPYLIAVLVVLVAGLFVYEGFLPPVDASEDGFQAQLLYVGSLLSDGELFSGAEDSSLVWVHLARLFAVSPFVSIELALGSAGSLVLLLLLLLPLVRYPVEDKWSPMQLVPLMLPLLVSGRSVLVSVGVAYVLIYLLRRDSGAWNLWLGLGFANLSSASVMTSLLLLVFVNSEKTSKLGARLHWAAALFVLGLSFLASLIDKYQGFQVGSAGYEAHAFTSESLVLSIVSRSTLLVSFVEGQYMRFIVYLVIAAYLGFKLVSLLRDKEAQKGRHVLLCCFPGVLMEGLGVLALFFPLVWLMSGWRRDLLAMPRPIGFRARRAPPAPLTSALPP
ncbi:MAG: hypothetical protein KF892_10800 [Rhizobacter sp.]|nr:hypothetical protein [Rhizobacter sp.]